MKKKFVASLIVVIVLILTPAAVLAEKLVFLGTEWPPYMFTENGQPTGTDVEIIRELCKRVGIEPEIRLVPWGRALRETETGRADAIFFPRPTKEREAFLYLTPEPANIEKTVIIANKKNNIKAGKIDDLKDKKFGVVRGYTYGPEFDNYNGLKKTVCDDDEQMVKMLGRGRVDLAMGEEGVLKYNIKKLGLKESFETVYILSEDPNYLGFSKKALGEKGKELAEKFGQALRQIKEEGVIEKIRSKYF